MKEETKFWLAVSFIIAVCVLILSVAFHVGEVYSAVDIHVVDGRIHNVTMDESDNDYFFVTFDVGDNSQIKVRTDAVSLDFLDGYDGRMIIKFRQFVNHDTGYWFIRMYEMNVVLKLDGYGG